MLEKYQYKKDSKNYKWGRMCKTFRNEFSNKWRGYWDLCKTKYRK